MAGSCEYVQRSPLEQFPAWKYAQGSRGLNVFAMGGNIAACPPLVELSDPKGNAIGVMCLLLKTLSAVLGLGFCNSQL
jgi:hypothetical protein